MQDMTIKDLVRMIEFVDMRVEDLSPAIYPWHIKIRRNGGVLCSLGHGSTRKDAILAALGGQNMDWYSVRERMFDADCKSIMHV